MEKEILEKEKRVNWWLTHAEREDPKVMAALQPQFRVYKERGYLVTVYVSGREDLRESVRDLLIFNRTRLREIEAAREKAAGEKTAGEPDRAAIRQLRRKRNQLER